MISSEQDLLDLKKDIESAKTEVSQFKGQVTAMLKQLKDNYESSTEEEAKIKLGKLKKQLVTLQEKIDQGIEELEEKLKEKEDES